VLFRVFLAAIFPPVIVGRSAREASPDADVFRMGASKTRGTKDGSSVVIGVCCGSAFIGVCLTKTGATVVVLFAVIFGVASASFFNGKFDAVFSVK